MITLHKLNGSEFSVNAELVEAVEAIPDTRITLITGNQYIVKEPVDAVIEKIKEYRKQIQQNETSRKKAVIEKKNR